jgi:hypothetical protein
VEGVLIFHQDELPRIRQLFDSHQSKNNGTGQQSFQLFISVCFKLECQKYFLA